MSFDSCFLTNRKFCTTSFILFTIMYFNLALHSLSKIGVKYLSIFQLENCLFQLFNNKVISAQICGIGNWEGGGLYEGVRTTPQNAPVRAKEIDRACVCMFVYEGERKSIPAAVHCRNRKLTFPSIFDYKHSIFIHRESMEAYLYKQVLR